MSKFSPGDRVRIRQWDDMAQEFGLTSYGSIQCRYTFARSMKSLCGAEAVISSIDANDRLVNLQFDPPVDNCQIYVYSEDMLEPADPPPNIYITPDELAALLLE